MRRYAPAGASYSFGPGPLTPVIKALVIANVAAFLLRRLAPSLTIYFGLIPEAVFQQLWVWQPLTYMFLHGGIFHILFNMLALWMFGTEFERMWGSRYFLRYYLTTGVVAAGTTLAFSLLPFDFADQMYRSVTIGASGAVYGVLIAYGLYFPNRPIYLYMIFPIPAKYFVLLLGGITFLADQSGGVAHAAHLGGAVGGYFMLRGGSFRPLATLKYHYARFKFARDRRKFDVYHGGRDDWDRRIH